ncbi:MULTISPECIES: TRAP transporter small permease [Salinicoccus]|uniref:Tripartite ATP-independent periplasmic transporters DctQ component domain-containing protein n=1 Tax=Salinicoccus roseus TaxID=45670 RepID=A0A265E7N2_9STAP|nr:MULTISPECIES: TRAP transporter small permease subunit [Salinicoccus]MCC4722893.1 TRAP transporter small permease subunit [Salinicoccus sp. RF5]OZT77446.1 hypothetical protein CFN03_05765 [Salinicoccus roseus]
MKFAKVFFRLLEKVLSFLTIISFIGLVAVVLLQIGARFTTTSFIWTEETTRYLFLFTIAFGAGLGVIKNEYMGIDFILEIFSEKGRALYLRSTYVIMIITNGIIAYYGYEFILLGQGQDTSTLGFSMAYIHLSIFLMAFFIMIFYIEKLIDKDVNLQ